MSVGGGAAIGAALLYMCLSSTSRGWLGASGLVFIVLGVYLVWSSGRFSQHRPALRRYEETRDE